MNFRGTKGEWSYDEEDKVILANENGLLGRPYDSSDFACLEEDLENQVDEEAKYNGKLWAASKELLEIVYKLAESTTDKEMWILKMKSEQLLSKILD